MRADDDRQTAGAPSDWPERSASHEAALPESGAIPGYRLVALIHRGGQGAVYRAVQLSTGRDVAVKILPGGGLASDVERRRFERERELVALLDHPNVVTLIDSGEAGGQPFIAMHLVDGDDLDAWVARAKPSLAEKLRVLLAACDGVAHAHQRGVIHRDLKPRNIRVDHAGQAHVLDFGLGKPLADLVGPNASSLTMDGHFIGTLAFAAPEQLSGDHSRTDVRTDVHALGLILYWLLTGRMPYATSGDVSEVLRAVQLADPEPPRRHVPGLDLDLQTIVLKALSKDPSRRYPTVDAFAADVRRHLAGEPIDARRDSRWYVLTRTARRHRVIVGAAVTVIAVLVAGIVGVLIQRDEARRQAALAEASAAEARAARARAEVEAASSDQIAQVLSGAFNLTSDIAGPPADVTVAQLIDRARDKLLPDLEDRPIVQSRVALSFATAYRTLGRHEDALALMDHLTRLADSPEARPEYRYEAAQLVASLVNAEHDKAAAEPFHRRAVALAREFDAVLPPTTLPSSLLAYSNVLMNLQRKDEAARLIEEAARLAVVRAGDDKVFLAKMTERLGDLRRSQGNEAEALRLRGEARELYVAHAGGPSAAAANSLSMDALVCFETGRPIEAEAFARESLAMFTALKMTEHPLWAQAQNHLGLALREQRRFDEARLAFDRALRVFREKAGEGHIMVETVLKNIAELEDLRGDGAAAARAWAEHRAWQAQYGEPPPRP